MLHDFLFPLSAALLLIVSICSCWNAHTAPHQTYQTNPRFLQGCRLWFKITSWTWGSLPFVTVLGWKRQNVCLHGVCVSCCRVNRFLSPVLSACWSPADGFTLSFKQHRLEQSLLNSASIWLMYLITPPLSWFSLSIHSLLREHPWNLHVSHGPLMFMLADAICLIPRRHFCILIPSLSGGSRNKGSMRKYCVINYTVCSFLIFSSYGLLLYVFFPIDVAPTTFLLCYAVCCGSLVRFLCYFNSFGKYHTALLPLCCLPFPLSATISLFLWYLCSCICGSLLSSVFSHPLPTHTPCPCTVGSIQYMCIEALETTFFSFKLASHLAALFSTYPRRGLTAGNINKMARRDTEKSHTHICTTHTHANTL